MAWRTLVGLAILLPPALVVIAIGRYAVDVPFWDQWALVEPLRKLYASQLSFSDLWAQHNEHRIVLPRLVMLALDWASRWNILYELYANVAFALLTFLFLWKLLRTTLHQISPTFALMLAVLSSMFTFSLAQWENWTWGWQVAFFMNALGGVVAVWSLSRWPADWRGPAVAFGAALFSIFSSANGLVLLGILPLGVLLGRQSRRDVVALALAVLGGAVLWLYFTGYAKPAHHPDPLYFMAHPAEYLAFVLVYLGAPVGAWRPKPALVFGLLGLLVLCGSAGWLWWRAPASRSVILPWLLLAVYAVGSGAATGLGRAGFGTNQALASRYTTFSGLFWISLFVVGAVAFTLAFPRGGAHGRLALPAAAVVALLTVFVGIGYAITSSRAYSVLKIHHARLLKSKDCLLYYTRASDTCLETVYPSASDVREWARTLERLRLGPFAIGNAGIPRSKHGP